MKRGHFFNINFRAIFLLCILVSNFRCSAEDLGSSIDVEALEKSSDSVLFRRWRDIALAHPVSPAFGDPASKSITWNAPSGHEVKLAIRTPVVEGKPEYLVRVPPLGSDAGSLIQGALDEAKKLGAGVIRFETGRYDFKSLPRDLGHLLLSDFENVKIDGGGSEWVFHRNKVGIYIQGCRSLEIGNLTLSYGFPSTSVGVVTNRGGKKNLQIPARPVGSDSYGVYQINEVYADRLVPDGLRFVIPRELQSEITYDSGGVESRLLSELVVGGRYRVHNYWYGGQAIYLGGMKAFRQNEDITIKAVVIHDTPGVAVAVERLKRGLWIDGLNVVPRSNDRHPVSSSWDGVHISQGGGDILIENSRFVGNGDDAINISNPVHIVAGFDGDRKILDLAVRHDDIYSGGNLLFFNKAGGFLGKVKVKEILDKKFRMLSLLLEEFPAWIKPGLIVRAEEGIASRYVIQRVHVSDCVCHAVLGQIPFGLIDDNVFERTSANAVRLLTDTSKWNEGVGAFSVVVSRNLVNNPGVDRDKTHKWGAISIYGGVEGDGVVNSDIHVMNNVIHGHRQECFVFTNSKAVVEFDNFCGRYVH